MIFDALTHVTPDGRWFDTAHDAGLSRLLGEMDEAGVERAVVVALADYIPNEFVLQVCRRHPDRLVPGASFNPAAHATAGEAARELRAQLRDAPFHALKLHPRFNRYDPLDPRCLAALEELSAWARPPAVWVCSLLYYRGGALRKPPVDTLHEIVGRFPALTFILAHAGGAWALQLAEAVRDCPNAYLDLSFTLARYAGSSLWTDLRYLLNTFDRRLVFGSDFPEVGVGRAVRLFGELAEGAPPEKCANVLGDNLLSVMREA